MKKIFSQEQAFARNQGWMTEAEMKMIGRKTVAIAGMGGVGGHYAEAMARMGFSRFHLADFDHYEVANFNRQNGAGMSTLGQKKLDVIAGRILDINPTAEIVRFEKGIHAENIDAFLSGVDIYLDGLDFFCQRERILTFRKLRELGIPGITVAPVGMGAAALVFTKDSMSFDDYFGMSEERSEQENSVHFLAGLTPTAMQRSYLADASKVCLRERRVSSTPMGCYAAAGIAVSIAVKICIGRGEVLVAPYNLHFDAFLNEYKVRKVWFGFKNPWITLIRSLIRRVVLKEQKVLPMPTEESV